MADIESTQVALSPYFKNFIARQVEAGRFESASEVVKEGLRLLEERELHLQALREALIEGEKSGFSPTPFDLEEFLEEIRPEHAMPR